MDINGTNNPRTNGLSFLKYPMFERVLWHDSGCVCVRFFQTMAWMLRWTFSRSEAAAKVEWSKMRFKRAEVLVACTWWTQSCFQLTIKCCFFFSLCLEMLFLDYLMIIWRSPFLSGTSLIRSEKFSGGRLSKTTTLVNTYTAANDELRFLLNNY